MITPQPYVETACARLQQEEAHSEVLKANKMEIESSVMYASHSHTQGSTMLAKGKGEMLEGSRISKVACQLQEDAKRRNIF